MVYTCTTLSFSSRKEDTRPSFWVFISDNCVHFQINMAIERKLKTGVQGAKSAAPTTEHTDGGSKLICFVDKPRE